MVALGRTFEIEATIELEIGVHRAKKGPLLERFKQKTMHGGRDSHLSLMLRLYLW